MLQGALSDNLASSLRSAADLAGLQRLDLPALTKALLDLSAGLTVKRTAREVFPAGRSMLCQGMIRGALLPCTPAQQHTTPAHLSHRTCQTSQTAPHTRRQSQHCQRLAPTPAAAVLVSTAPAQTADETEAAAPDEDWKIGEAGLQGPRDSMEDYTSIIRCGRCGFLVACECSG